MRPPKPWSPNTIKSTIKHVRSFFVAAIDQGLIKRNPFQGVEVQAQKVGPAAVHISPELATVLIDTSLNRKSPTTGRSVSSWTPTSWAAAIGLARFAGMRMSEVVALTVDRLDLNCEHHDQPTVTVRNSKTFDSGGNKREFREVPIHSYLVGILRRRIEAMPEGALYVVGDGWKPMSKSTLALDDWLFEQAGRPRIKRLFQNCRRSYCNDLRNTVPIDAYCEIVGHSIETAYKFYLHTEARHRKAIAESIGPSPSPLKLAGA